MHYSAPLAVYYTSNNKWQEALEFEESGIYFLFRAQL